MGTSLRRLVVRGLSLAVGWGLSLVGGVGMVLGLGVRGVVHDGDRSVFFSLFTCRCLIPEGPRLPSTRARSIILNLFGIGCVGLLS